MNKTELKNVLKPLIKECIRESLFEEGILSGVITEVVKALSTAQQPIVEQKQNRETIRKMQLEEKEKINNKLNETRKKMLDVINKDAYGGVNVFEGTSPITRGGEPGARPETQGPLSGVDPSDPGVDISGLFGSFKR